MKKYTRMIYIVIFLFPFIFILDGCKSAKIGPTQSIEAYIQALGNKDTVKITNLSCADWEKNALVEIDSLTAVGSKIENLSCEQSGQDGADTFVSCKGVIALDYNGENQQIDLSTRIYIARQEAGEWRMCGYR